MLCSGSSWEVSSCFPAQPAACLCACTSPLHFGELMTDSFPSQLLPPRNRRGGVPVSQKHAAQIEFSQAVCVSASVHKNPCSLQLGAWQFEWEVGLVTGPSFDLYPRYLRCKYDHSDAGDTYMYKYNLYRYKRRKNGYKS